MRHTDCCIFVNNFLYPPKLFPRRRRKMNRKSLKKRSPNSRNQKKNSNRRTMTSCLSWQEGESGKKNSRCVFRRNRRNRNKSRMCTRFHQERDNNRVDRDNNRCLRSRWWSSLRNLRDWTWRCFPDMNRHSRQCTARHRRHNRFS